MSTFALARGPRGVLGAWEAEGRIRYGRIGEELERRTASGDAEHCKHPSIACNANGEVLVVWIEGMAWNTPGTLAWQRFAASGKPIDSGRGSDGGVATWSLVQAIALQGGRFEILY